MDISEKIKQLLSADPSLHIGMEIKIGENKTLTISVYADDYLIASFNVDSVKTILV